MVTYNYMLGMFASMAISSSCDKVSGRIGNCSIDQPSVCFFLDGTNVNLGSAGFTCMSSANGGGEVYNLLRLCRPRLDVLICFFL